MTRQEKQEALRARGLTQAEFARRIGVSEVSVSLFLRKRFKSKKMEDEFARIMQLPVLEQSTK